MTAFRFGLVSAGGHSLADWREIARITEALGYQTLLMPDHLGHQLAPFPALVAAADATAFLRVGTFVASNELRHPVLLAREAATVDLLTEGRFELGLGMGWMRAEFAAAGLPFPDAPTRVERLAEAVALLDELFRADEVTVAGAHYPVAQLPPGPSSHQRPRPPLLVGGGGQQVLSLAARTADTVSIIPRATPEGDRLESEDLTVAAFERKLGWIEEAAGDRAPERNTLMLAVAVTEDRATAAAALARELGVDPDTVLTSPHLLVGGVQRITEELQARRERWGLSYIAVFEDALESFAPVVEALAGT